MIEYAINGAITLSVAYASYLFGRRKMQAEVRKIEAEIESEETDTAERVVKFYKTEMESMLNTIEQLRQKINVLEKMVHDLSEKQCQISNCPARLAFDDDKK